MSRAPALLQPPAAFLALASVCLVGWFFHYVYALFHQFDWGQAVAKLICFSACFAMLLLLAAKHQFQPILSQTFYKLEFLLAVTALVWLISVMTPKYLTHLERGPRVDIGFTTQSSALLLFRQGENPYVSEAINVRPELNPEYRGFHYGPGMLLGYAASAILPDRGYSITNLVYLLATVVTLVLLIDAMRPANATIWQRASGGLIVTFLLLLPERLWHEVFQQGVNDVFPVWLLLIGLLCVKKNYLFWAGVALGLSFATKFSPAAFLLALFLRKNITLKFLLGCCVGVVPLILFMVWDFRGVMDNVFVLRFRLKYDSTSLYSLTPESLHYVFPVIQLAAVLFAVKKNFLRELDLDRLVLHFSLLLIVIEVTFKEVHGNHLVWFFPLFAYVATRHRHQLILALVGWPPSPASSR